MKIRIGVKPVSVVSIAQIGFLKKFSITLHTQILLVTIICDNSDKAGILRYY
jgi:hypothetical protein